MKITTLVILCFFISGCATFRQWQSERQEMARVENNIYTAVINKENLVGRTSQQIVQEFGNSNNVNTTYSTLDYFYVDPSEIKYEFQLQVQNGVVTSVHYLAPYSVAPVEIVIHQETSESSSESPDEHKNKQRRKDHEEPASQQEQTAPQQIQTSSPGARLPILVESDELLEKSKKLQEECAKHDAQHNQMIQEMRNSGLDPARYGLK
ncbi:MAG: hypothetical protein HQL26_05555 [Candidatus Omnitrophica bacterium]|nr:hypothetical protein [Candidatus Omnitrophota bacterium]